MTHFRIQDVRGLENPSVSAGTLRAKISEMILGSTVCRAKVETVNPDTGEYRVVLQGTLEKEGTRFER